MEWIERMNGAIIYIEDNINENIDYEKVAQIACCSVYNFQRMFSFILDIPLSEYIRRRRLTLAAFELQNSDIKIVDLAFKYGYDTHESFARAFQKFHGVTPSLARDRGVTLKACSRISFQISIKGEMDMNYKIVDKEEFEVFGIEKIFSSSKNVSEFWQECHNNGAYEKLFEDSGKGKHEKGKEEICAINAVLNYRQTDKNTFSYMLFSFVTDKSSTEGYTRVKIPAQTYAIFRSEEHSWDTLMIPVLFKRIYSEWLPISDYVKLDGPDFEIYGCTANGNAFSEVWIPVVKKSK